jgi:NAD(P)-dependent dehydrogenase (short-subunit alcohol dehydrogenase family)
MVRSLTVFTPQTRVSRLRRSYGCCPADGPTVSDRTFRTSKAAAAVAFLASDDASFITAWAFPVDGGVSGAYVTPL